MERTAGQLPAVRGYELVSLLGRGGFASVYRAHQLSVDREVALKVLDAGGVDDDAERRFRAECRSISSLSWHPHVVVVFDAGLSDDGRPYLAMELLDGGSLADRLTQSGAMPVADVVQVGIQISDALAAAHRAGIVHRDVKPGNVLIGRRGEYLLSDFGIAAFSDSTRSVSGQFWGTLAYSAPEVLLGERATPSADQFSLGVTLHSLLLGRSSFASEGSTAPGAVIQRVINGPLPDLPAAVPEWLSEVVARATAKSAADRYPSLEAMHAAMTSAGRAALEPAVDADHPADDPEFDRTVASGGPPPRPQQPVAVQQFDGLRELQLRSRRRRKRRRAIAATSAVAATLAIALGLRTLMPDTEQVVAADAEAGSATDGEVAGPDAEIALGDDQVIDQMITGDGLLWTLGRLVPSSVTEMIRVDTETGDVQPEVPQSVTAGPLLVDIAYAEEAIWTLQADPAGGSSLSAAGLDGSARISRLPFVASQLQASDEALWVTAEDPGTGFAQRLVRLDTFTDVVAERDLGAPISAYAATPTTVWVVAGVPGGANQLLKLNANDLTTIAAIDLDYSAVTDIAADELQVWMSAQFGELNTVSPQESRQTRNLLVRIDPDTSAVSDEIDLDDAFATRLAFSGRNLWVVTQDRAERPGGTGPFRLERRNLGTGKLVDRFDLDGAGGPITAGAGGGAWVAVTDPDEQGAPGRNPRLLRFS